MIPAHTSRGGGYGSCLPAFPFVSQAHTVVDSARLAPDESFADTAIPYVRTHTHRNIKAHDRKVRKARAKQNKDLAKRLAALTPTYRLDHLVKER